MNSKLQQRTISKVLLINNTKLLEVLLLSALGGFAIILRAKLRIPINIPGHHGVEVMALLIAGRSFSKMKLASSISTLVAALIIFFPFMGFKDPFMPLIYVFLGLSMDFLYNSFQKWQKNIVFLSLLGGLTYMIIPLSRIIISLTTGFQYSSLFKHGFVIPLFTHFAFGMLGALIGSSIMQTLKKNK
ncbi:MAG: hypothetical protein JXR36_03455 [Bacteroidales bacterium]|nr:hypothetical protein [Bacteroidales bacterium]